MGESKLHIDLVKSLYNYIEKLYLNNDGGMLLSDLPGSDSLSKPPKIKKYIPDIYYLNTMNDMIIIGEAKTPSDLEREHSFKQFEAFLKECESHSISYFILAVPWDFVRLSKSILKEIKFKVELKKVNIIIPDKFIV